MTATGDRAFAGRLVRFTAARYKPHYLLYGVLWVAAVEGTAALIGAPGSVWRPGGATAVRILVVVLVLLWLRMVDELKDFDYDREHHPDRPLVTGAVRAGDLYAGMGLIAVVTLAASCWWSLRSVVWLAAVLGYGLGLWALERASPAVHHSILLNLAVTYPIQLMLTGYVIGSALDTGQVAWSARLVALPLIFAGAFLHFEAARKTAAGPRPGEAYYSNVLGATGAAAVTLGLAGFAVLAYWVTVRAWEFHGGRAVAAWTAVGLLVLPVASTVRFAGFTRARRHPAAPFFRIRTLFPARKGVRIPKKSATGGGDRPGEGEYPVLPAVAFVMLLYVDLIVAAAVAG